MTRVLTSAEQAEPSAVQRKAAQLTSKVVETGSQFTPGSNDRAYGAERIARLRRGRLVGFAVCIPLWVLSVVPLARVSMGGRESADALLVYLAVGALGLGVAAAIRTVYVLLTKRRFWTPWVFVMAAVVMLATYAVQTAGEEVVPVAQALESSAE